MLKIIAISVGGVLALLALFVLYRIIATIRASRARDLRILEELGEFVPLVEDGGVPSRAQIDDACRMPHRRVMVHQLLSAFGHDALFPAEFHGSVEHARASLAAWMMHANEMGDPPEQIELLRTVPRRAGVSSGVFHVLRFRMPDGHWGSSDGWLLGVSGPYREGEDPYVADTFQFARIGDDERSTDPDDVAAWWEAMLIRKGALES